MSSAILRSPKFYAVNEIGEPLEGGRVYTYAAGTSIKKTTYSDFEQDTENTNPIILDARGEADIWFSGILKIALHDEDDVLIWTFDDIATFEDSFSIPAGQDLNFGAGSCLLFEGTTADDWELRVCPGDPTADRLIVFPDASGNLLTTPLAENIDGNGKTITKTPAASRTITASDTLVAADGNKIVYADHASVAIVVTLDGSSLDEGFTCTVTQQNDAAVSFASAGSIVSKYDDVILNGKGTGAIVVHKGSNDWWLVGDLK